MSPKRYFEWGRWGRFERYEIRNGFIVPAAGSKMESYNPWAVVNPTRKPRPFAPLPEPPYRDLVALGDLTRGKERLDDELEKAVLDQCAAHGLLGLGVQVAQRIRLTPRWEKHPAPNDSDAKLPEFRRQGAAQLLRIPGVAAHAPTETDVTSADSVHLVAVQRQHVRLPTGTWKTRDDTLYAFRPKNVERREGEPIALHILPANNQPSVGRIDPASGEWTEATLNVAASEGIAWGDFFPDVAPEEKETFQYPTPLSDEFWRTYGEPVEDFLGVAQGFADIVHALLPEPGTGPIRRGKSPIEIQHQIRVLNGLLSSTSAVAFQFTDGSIQQKWTPPSLLAAYGMMALRDIAKHRVVHCEGCNRLMQAARTNKRFCSQACRWRAQQRHRRTQRRIG